jgi:hypothetical protein
LRPEARRNDRGVGFTNASELGGFELFCEFFPNRASNSATRPASSTIKASRDASAASRSASRTNNCSTEAAAGIGDSNGGSTTKHLPAGEVANGQVKPPATQA